MNAVQPNVPRLLHLITVLQNVEATGANFNMGTWLYQNECGTTACAFGWAALDPVFRAQGLTTKRREINWTPITMLVPTFDGATGYTAAARFFEIPYNDAYTVFRPREFMDNTDPQDVIDRINRLLAKYNCKAPEPQPAPEPVRELELA